MLLTLALRRILGCEVEVGVPERVLGVQLVNLLATVVRLASKVSSELGPNSCLHWPFSYAVAAQQWLLFRFHSGCAL